MERLHSRFCRNYLNSVKAAEYVILSQMEIRYTINTLQCTLYANKCVSECLNASVFRFVLSVFECPFYSRRHTSGRYFWKWINSAEICYCHLLITPLRSFTQPSTRKIAFWVKQSLNHLYLLPVVWCWFSEGLCLCLHQWFSTGDPLLVDRGPLNIKK